MPDTGSDTRTYLRSAWLTFGGQLAMVCLAFGANVVIARAIGPSGRGVVSLVYLFPFFAAMLLGFGIDEANVYFLGSKRESHATAVSNVILVTVLGTVICIACSLLARDFLLSKVLKNMDPAFFVFAAVSLPFFLFNRLGTTIFQGHRDFVSFNAVNVGVKVFGLLIPVVLLVVLRMGIRGGALSVPVAAASVSALVLALLLAKGRPSRRPDLSMVRASLSYGLRAQPGVLMNFFDRRLDVFIINFFMTTADVGLYVIGVSMAELLWNLPNAVGLTLFPKIASSEEDAGEKFTCLVARNLLFVMLVAGGILALAGKPLLLLLFGGRFHASLLPFWILLPGIVFLGMARVMSSNFHGRGKPQYGTYITSISVTLTVILDIVLIPRMGIVGASLASTIAYTSAGVIAVAWFAKRNSISLSELLFVRWQEVRRYPALAVSALRR